MAQAAQVTGGGGHVEQGMGTDSGERGGGTSKSKGGLAHKAQGRGDGYRVTHTLEGAGRRPATRGGAAAGGALSAQERGQEREERRIMNRTEEGDEKAPVLCPPAAMA